MRRRIAWIITASTFAVAALLFYTSAFVAKRSSEREPQVLLWSERRYHPDPETSLEIEAAYRFLQDLRLPHVDFQSIPFDEALRQL